MLVVGGADSNSDKLDSCELYDAAADRWSLQAARLPQPMLCRAAPIAGGSAVLAVQFGMTPRRRGVRSVRRAIKLAVVAADDVPRQRARRFPAVVAVGEFSVVMLGGEDARYRLTDTVQLYDARADRWSARPEWRLPVPSAFHCAVVID